MSDNLKTWPDRIRLQHSEDGYPVPTYKVETDEITWCEHQQFDSDIEYVRADRIAELERQVAEQERLLIGVRRYLKPNDPEPGHMTIEGMNGPEICEWCAHVDAALAQAKTEGANNG